MQPNLFTRTVAALSIAYIRNKSKNMIITMTIDDAKLAEYKDAFLRVFPIDKDEEGEPKYTVQQWFKKKVKMIVLERLIKKGVRLLAIDSAIVPDDTITVT